jgi:hypothetical protein
LIGRRVVILGVEPAEETTANGNGVHKVLAQVFMQCITAPAPSYDRCAADICSLITEEKYKGMLSSILLSRIGVRFSTPKTSKIGISSI